MLKRLPIRLKFIAIYVNMAIFTIPMMIISYYAMWWTGDSISGILRVQMGVMEQTMHMETYLQEQKAHALDGILHFEDPTFLAGTVTDIEADREGLEDAFREYAALVDDSDSTGREMREFVRDMYYDSYLPKVNAFIAALQAGDRVEAVRTLEETAPVLDTFFTTMEDITEHYSVQAAATEAASKQVVKGFAIGYPIFLLVYLLVTIRIGRMLTKLIAYPVSELAGSARSIAQGDIDFHMTYDSPDEVGMLVKEFRAMTDGVRQQADVLEHIAQGDFTVTIPVRSDRDVMNRSINTMVETNRKMLSDIKAAASQVSNGAQQIAEGAQSLATGSSEQASTVEQFSAAISEVQIQAESNSGIADEVVEDTREASRLMEVCIGSMDEMNDSMEAISQSSSNIGKVIKVIDDIAFQTNILALNAAVEAARAGQHGKGFAVVADEVRNLATKSADAAKETSGLIEDSVKNVEIGSRIAKQTGESIQEMAQISKRNAESMERLRAASSQQSESISQITEGIGQISAVVQANSATAEQSAASAQEMSAQAALLSEIVRATNLGDGAALSAPVQEQHEQPELTLEHGFALSTGTDKY